MSIIGESINNSVSSQISIRQYLHGKQTRNKSDISVLSNNNAWLKLASSVRVIGQTVSEKCGEEYNEESIPTYNPTTGKFEELESNISAGEQKLRDIGLDNTSKFTGNQLARKAILFNTLSELSPDGGNTYINRSGVSKTNSLWNNSSYGLGGTDFGLVPSPGLISAKIDCKNRGSIREATIELKAYNKFQFELIELLYLKLGYTMLLEWGWSKYVDNSGTLKFVENTLIEDMWFNDKNNFNEIIKEISTYQRKYSSNYDGFLGKVVNFDWNFQPDGTYNITLKLITIGDVIESLKVKLPSDLVSAASLKRTLEKGNAQTAQLKTVSSPIITNAGSSTLSLNLFNDIASSKPDFWSGNQTNYFSLFSNLKETDSFGTEIDYVIRKKYKSNEDDQFRPTGVDSNKYTYYLTFRELLAKLEKYCIPSINTDKVLTFDTSTESICSTFINQISFNPKICLIKPAFTSALNISTPQELKDKKLGVKNFYKAFAKLKNFTIQEEETNIIYGDIMNIYLNYDFVSTILEKNTKDGNITLFKFLSSICDGINDSLGNLNKLEPIIQDDNVIKIIDQNPIPGIEKSTNFGCRFVETPTSFEIYGYNYSDNTKSTSNFVWDFGFRTKIGPELASMITIGATAQNESTKNYDGTSFSKWTEGLKDAYAVDYDDPEDAELTPPKIQPEFYPFTSEQVQKMYEHFNEADIDFFYGPDFLSYSNVLFDLPTWRKQEITYVGTYKGTGTRDIDKRCPVTKRTYSNVTWAKYFLEAKTSYIKTLAKREKDDLPEDLNIQSYVQWLINALGGKLNGRTIEEPLYFYFNSDFYKIGSSLFKGFINQINTQVYEKGNKLVPSNTIGFIPMDLNLTIDGLSGIKIFNALDVNQRFLPKAYSTSLKFIITKVNHEISNNNWGTSLGTIVVPKINEITPYIFSIPEENLKKQTARNSRYEELPVLTSFPSSKLTYVKAKEILLRIAGEDLGLAIFAILWSEASKSNGSFNSAGGNNYSEVQTDSGVWGGSKDSISSKLIVARFSREDAVSLREFAAFENDENFLKFMQNRVSAKGFTSNPYNWTTTYINKWWSPEGKENFTSDSPTYKTKLSFFQSAKKTWDNI